MRRLVLGAVLLAVAACAPQPPPHARRGAPTPLVRPSPYATPTPYVTPRPSAQPEPPAAAADACGAAAHAYLVGKAKTEIPIPVDPANRRVACSTCPVTEDHVPTRLNIVYDERSNLITEVRCG